MSFLTPRSLNSVALWVKFTSAGFVPPLRNRNGGSAYLRLAAPHHTKVPQAPLYTRTHHVPRPCPLPPAPGRCAERPGGESIAPSSSLQASLRHLEPTAAAGPCLQRGAAPRRVHRPPGAASEHAGTPEHVCPRSRCSGESNFISFYWVFFPTP